MIGIQKHIIDNKIRVYGLADEIKVSPSMIYDWFIKNKVPDRYIPILAQKFNLPEEYLNQKVNDIVTYKPKYTPVQYKIFDDYAVGYIKKNNGMIIEFFIDIEDLEKAKEIPQWGAIWDKTSASYYVKTTHKSEDGTAESILLHRYILELTDSNMIVDHIDHNPLNNRRSNLRVTTTQNNTRYREMKNSTNNSGYRNVCWLKEDNKWCVQLQIDGKNTRLAYFTDVDEAGKFAEEMREIYYGNFAGGS